jgi:16S rRNA (guanine1207-N2)-methyltransferase
VQDNPYFKKTVRFSFYKHTFQFAVAQELFSSSQIDPGSQLLLRTIAEAGYRGVQRIADIGCGVGSLGISLTALYENPYVLMTDRDALALEFAAFNAKQNKLRRADVQASLDFESVSDGKFDLIVSNLPGKAGEEVLENVILGSQQYLAETGRVAVVVVTPLADSIKETLEAHSNVEIVLTKANKAYTVFHYRFTEQDLSFRQRSFDKGLYDRSEISALVSGIQLKTVQGISEFDGLHYRTQLLEERILEFPPRKGTHCVLANPGQGYISVLLAQFDPSRLVIVSRDLLALKNSERALKTTPHSYKALFVHAASLPNRTETELLVYPLGEHQNLAAVVNDLRRTNFKRLLLAGKSSQVQQVGLLIKRSGIDLRQTGSANSQGQRLLDLRRG